MREKDKRKNKGFGLGEKRDKRKGEKKRGKKKHVL